MGQSGPEVIVKDKGQTNGFPWAPKSLVSKPCIPLFHPSLTTHPKSPSHSFLCLFTHSFLHIHSPALLFIPLSVDKVIMSFKLTF